VVKGKAKAKSKAQQNKSKTNFLKQDEIKQKQNNHK